MSNNLLAAVALSLIALLVTGLLAETYWDCRLVRHYTTKECLSFGIGRVDLRPGRAAH